ncbi:MAG TPA: DUF6744 family protein [Planctomycetota bacterium]|jgi:hypothetical protein
MPDQIPGHMLWTFSVQKCRLSTLRDALVESGIAPEKARELPKRYAFIRAIKNLEADGIILPVTEDEDRLLFQLSDKATEWIEGRDRLTLKYRQQFWFNKKAETLGTDGDNIDAIRQMFEDARDMYTAGQVSHLLRKVLDDNKAIVPLRPNGVLYFVPESYEDLLKQIKSFGKLIGTQIRTKTVGFTEADIMQDALSGLASKIKSDLAAITKDVRENGLTPQKAANRWDSIVGQIRRAAAFADSMRVSAADILKGVSSAEIDLSLVSGADSIDVVACLTQAGKVRGVLGDIAQALTEGHELPALDSARVQAALFAAACPVVDDMELPAVASAISIPVPDFTPDQHEQLRLTLLEARRVLSA